MWMSTKFSKNQMFLLGILLIGFFLRFGYVLTQDNEIFWIDGIEYHALAQQVVNGNGYVKSDSTPTAFRPIGYPLLLMVLFKVGGTGLLWIRLMQVIISCATLFVTYLLAKRITNPTLALISASAVAVYPYFVFLPGAILPTCWFSFLLVCGVYLLIRSREKLRLLEIGLAGVVFGLATLTRPSTAVLVCIALIWMFTVNYSRLKLAIAGVVIFGLCVSIIVLPWVYRNYSVLGKAAIATNGGRNFWLGNNLDATATSGNNVALTNILEEHLSETQSEVEQERIYFSEGKHFITQHPNRFVRLSIAKAFNFWRFFPITTSGHPIMESLSRLVGTLSGGLLLLCGLSGLLMIWRSAKSEASLIILFLITFTFLHAIFISKVRMRLPLDHFIAIFASCTLERGWTLMKNVTSWAHHHIELRILDKIGVTNRV